MSFHICVKALGSYIKSEKGRKESKTAKDNHTVGNCRIAGALESSKHCKKEEETKDTKAAEVTKSSTKIAKCCNG